MDALPFLVWGRLEQHERQTEVVGGHMADTSDATEILPIRRKTLSNQSINMTQLFGVGWGVCLYRIAPSVTKGCLNIIDCNKYLKT